jgi:hypothetical protein
MYFGNMSLDSVLPRESSFATLSSLVTILDWAIKLVTRAIGRVDVMFSIHVAVEISLRGSSVLAIHCLALIWFDVTVHVAAYQR